MIRKYKKEELKGAVQLIVDMYELKFGELDEAYDLFIDVVDLDFNNYKVIFDYAYEYECLNDSGSAYTQNRKSIHFIIDKKSNVGTLKDDVYILLGKMTINEVRHI